MEVFHSDLVGCLLRSFFLFWSVYVFPQNMEGVGGFILGVLIENFLELI